MTGKPGFRLPSHLQRATRDWAASILTNFELESHHVRLLVLACEAWDRCQDARVALGQHGLIYVDRLGQPRARPEVAIERGQPHRVRALAARAGAGRPRAGRVAAGADSRERGGPPQSMRVIRRGKLRRPGYGPMQQGQLLHGFDFSLDGTGYGEPTHRWAGAVPFDAARARADWEAHRDELMEHWLSDPEAWWAAEGWRREEGYRRIQPGGPGTRPAGYWWFDAPEPRQIVAQWTWRGPSPHLGHLVAAPITVDTSDWPGLWRGPERWRHFGRGMRNPVPAVVDWETEREYLARLNLMSPEEVAALPAEDSERALDQTARYRAPTPRATPPRPSNGHPADMRGDPDRC